MGPWVPTLKSLRPQPNQNNPLVEPNLKVSVLTLEEPRRWNTLLFHALFSPESVNEILKIPLSNYNYSTSGDRIKWTLHSTEKFSVKSAYAAMINSQNYTSLQHIAETWKKLWRLNIQDRLKLLIRKVIHNILSTRSHLKRFITLEDDQALCPLCHIEEETLSHLFLNCSFSRILRRRLKWLINISQFALQPISD